MTTAADDAKVPQAAAPPASAMSIPAGFVGRQAELRLLSEGLAAARMSHPQVVYVEGEAGSGKSALVSRFLSSLSDAVVLAAGGDEAETLLTYGILDQLQPGTSDRARGGPDGRRRPAAGPARPEAGRRPGRGARH